jgi:GDP-4-dehydro-6-deoxy-D-mannose reductase
VEVPIPSRILITGFSGFVGRSLIEQCQALYPEAQLFGVCRQLKSPAASNGLDHITRFETDITDRDQLRHALAQARPDFVFHLAAQSSVAASWTDPALTLSINVGGTIELLEALRAEHLLPRVIIMGSGEQYGPILQGQNPIRENMPFQLISPYGVSKAAQDLYGYMYFVAYALPVLRVRLFNSFGPYQSAMFVIADFARQIALIEHGKLEPVLMVGNLEARRDFLPVEDVARSLLAIAKKGQPGQAYIIGSGQARSIREMLAIFLACSTASIEIRQNPARLRPVDIPLLVADTSRLHIHTGWEPAIQLEHAIDQTLNYWRKVVAQNA